MSESASYHVTLTADMDEPGLVPAAFDLLRTQAKACGLKDVEQIKIHLEVEVSGRVYDQQLGELRARLEALWFGEIQDTVIKEARQHA